MYLLDTNVLSATAPTEAQPDEIVREWMRENSHALYLSVITLLEVSYGLAWLRHSGATARAARLELWIDAVQNLYADRVLAADPAVVLRAGELVSAAQAAGAQVGSEDAIIGTTAERRGFVVLTADTRHFAPMGVTHLNPFDELPPVC